MGAIPDWYPLLRAARYLGVPPWELAAQPSAWMHMALAAELAENQAKAAAQRQSEGGTIGGG